MTSEDNFREALRDLGDVAAKGAIACAELQAALGSVGDVMRDNDPEA